MVDEMGFVPPTLIVGFDCRSCPHLKPYRSISQRPASLKEARVSRGESNRVFPAFGQPYRIRPLPRRTLSLCGRWVSRNCGNGSIGGAWFRCWSRRNHRAEQMLRHICIEYCQHTHSYQGISQQADLVRLVRSVAALA